MKHYEKAIKINRDYVLQLLHLTEHKNKVDCVIVVINLQNSLKGNYKGNTSCSHVKEL